MYVFINSSYFQGRCMYLLTHPIFKVQYCFGRLFERVFFINEPILFNLVHTVIQSSNGKREYCTALKNLFLPILWLRRFSANKHDTSPAPNTVIHWRCLLFFQRKSAWFGEYFGDLNAFWSAYFNWYRAKNSFLLNFSKISHLIIYCTYLLK